jgi:hypothetical protein
MKVTRIRDKLKRNEKWQIEYLTPSSLVFVPITCEIIKGVK